MTAYKFLMRLIFHGFDEKLPQDISQLRTPIRSFQRTNQTCISYKGGIVTKKKIEKHQKNHWTLAKSITADKSLKHI